jgi:hypothetical protein
VVGCDFVNFAFRLIQQIKYIGAVFVSITDDFTGNANKFALNKFLQDNTGVCLDVGRRNNGIR